MLMKARKVADKVLSGISAILFLIACLATCAGVIDRAFGLNLQLVWAEEVTRYTMIWSAMLLIGLGIRKGTQTRLTLLSEKLPHKGRSILSVIILLLVLFFFGILLIYGLRSAITNSSQVTAVLQISVFWPYMAIPVGAFLVVAECLILIYEIIFPPKNNADNGGERIW